ncbi:hypothetical protein OC845_003734 [Tilletia horrida]|nr:hypothetical protein OC845_003734 [Tilletia horrida]
MAGVWAIFLVGVSLVFEDPPNSEPPTTLLEDVKALANRARRHQVERIELTRDVKRDALQTRDGALQQDSPAPAPIISIEEQESRTHAPKTRLSASNWASLGLMCWTAMLTFFTIGAWEVNIPVFSADFPGLNWTEAKAGNVLALGAVIVLPLLFGLVFLAKHIQDRQILLTGMSIGLGGLIIHMVTLTPGLERSINFGSFFTSWVLVALGYNMMSTVTLSLLSKQVPPEFNNYTSLIIQLSNYSGRLGGAFWGTAVDQVGQRAIMSVELVLTLVGMLGTFVLWSRMYAPKG